LAQGVAESVKLGRGERYQMAYGLLLQTAKGAKAMKNQTNAEAFLGSVWSVAHRTLRTSSPCGAGSRKVKRGPCRRMEREVWAMQSDQRE
jgi:hypothetical protein